MTSGTEQGDFGFHNRVFTAALLVGVMGEEDLQLLHGRNFASMWVVPSSLW